MDDILGSAKLGNGRSIHVATLSRQTIIDAGAQHLGFGGYFLFEVASDQAVGSIDVLGKVASLEAAFRLLDIWQEHRVAA
ncbi:hypothetical protein [Xanthobacter tagetidis]|uniref:Uncharacterized protein n=1 Tax=Xanthobacter tagetidis TaxID=60216 RepID=A0A3L7AIE2_9HYPH|nr:hypothetical protein [Xanthobacter tagetidis]MBB6306196.1 hypothetical protein [Xanthobacter tagetidis]RLP79480.1 hypothetical protein D9R14_07395 [Xanthobacter tagetidis]